MIQPNERRLDLLWFAQPAQHLELGERKEQLWLVVGVDVINGRTITARAGARIAVLGLFQARMHLHGQWRSRCKKFQKKREFFTEAVYCPVPHRSAGVRTDHLRKIHLKLRNARSAGWMCTEPEFRRRARSRLGANKLWNGGNGSPRVVTSDTGQGKHASQPSRHRFTFPDLDPARSVWQGHFGSTARTTQGCRFGSVRAARRCGPNPGVRRIANLPFPFLTSAK